MTLETWARAAGFKNNELTNADSINSDLCGNAQAVVKANDGTTDIALNDCAPLRLTGLEILVSLTYKNKEFHHENDYAGRSQIRGDCGAGNTASGVWSLIWHRLDPSWIWSSVDDYDCYVVAYVRVKKNPGEYLWRFWS